MRRDRMLEALGNHFPSDAVWTRPDGGMFLLVTLPETVQARDLLPHALAQNVAFVPGDDFHLDHRGGNTLRLNFSNAMPDRIEEGVSRLGLILKKQMTAMMLPAAALLVPVPFLRHDVLADT
jgi:DNA-binding transcriptional MocR family regulator